MRVGPQTAPRGPQRGPRRARTDPRDRQARATGVTADGVTADRGRAGTCTGAPCSIYTGRARGRKKYIAGPRRLMPVDVGVLRTI